MKDKKKGKKKVKKVIKNGYDNCKFCKAFMRNDNIKRHILNKHPNDKWLIDKEV